MKMETSNVVTFTKDKITGSAILHLTLGLQAIGIGLPYLMCIYKKEIDPPLPFISQAVGIDIRSGIFTCLVISASFFGLLLSLILHIGAHCTDKRQKNLRIASSVCCNVYFLSWVLICAFPFPFTDVPSQYEWVWCVMWEHMVGALLMLGACVFYPVLQAFLSLSANSSKNSLGTSNAVFGVAVGIVGICALFKVTFEELTSKGSGNTKKEVYQLPIKLSFLYILTATCEWSLICCMWSTLGMLSEILQATEVAICLRKKTNSLASE